MVFEIHLPASFDLSVIEYICVCLGKRNEKYCYTKRLAVSAPFHALTKPWSCCNFPVDVGAILTHASMCRNLTMTGGLVAWLEKVAELDLFRLQLNSRLFVSCNNSR